MAGAERGLRAGESMDSLVFLCARRVVSQWPLPTLPADLYPVLFQVAFLDGRPLVLCDLVATWPFKELHVQQLVRPLELRWDFDIIISVKDIIQGVVEQLKQELEEPNSDSRFRLRVLDVTGVFDDPGDGITEALAMACVEVSKHQQEFQRHRRKRRKGCSGATTATPEPPGVDVHTDLFVSEMSYKILHDALQTGATAPLRIKCLKFEAQFLSASQIVTLLQCLDPSCLRRVKLGKAEVLEILPHLMHFPELRNLNLQYPDMFVQPHGPELANGIESLAGQLGMLPSLRELNMEDSCVSGNLHQMLGNLQTPLESLGFAACSLVPDDLTFLSQSFHAPALKRLKLSSYNISQGFLDPLRLLLEETSASLLHLDLSYCHIADSHLAVLLPTLLCCSRLRLLGLYSNPLSRAAIKDLLQKTLELPDLYLVVYPYPLDCYTWDPSEFDDFFDESLDHNLLSAAEAEISQLLENSGRTNLIWTDDPESLEDLDYFSL